MPFPRVAGVAPRNRDAVTWRHWLLLAASMWSAAASSTLIMGAAFLLPVLHTDMGLSLTHAGLVVAMPQVGILTTLIAWGWVVDRIGERIVLTSGLVLTAAATVGAAFAHSLWLLSAFLFLAGAAAASTNSASGRVVVGWFPARRRGLAMGARQMSTPLGAAIAAMTMPILAHQRGLGPALAVPAVTCAVAAAVAWVFVSDPARPEPRSQEAAHLTSSPYRASRHLWRIHGVSVLLVVPQALMSAFLLIWLMTAHHWGAGAAGIAVTAGQILGAIGRMVTGAWSDRIGSRMRPLRIVAVAAAIGAALLAVAEGLSARFGAQGSMWAGVAVVLAIALTVVSVADNGLAFTAVAEYAGPFWAGRALGTQNTSQFLAMAAMTPTFGALIERGGYPVTFAVTAAVAALAIPLVPRRDRHAERPEA